MILLEKAVQEIKRHRLLALDPVPPVTLELPRHPGLGDISTTIAMTLAPQEKKAPHQIAELIIRHLPQDEELFDKVEIAGPGFPP